MPIAVSSNSNQQTHTSAVKTRDPSADQPSRYGASAYVDQYDYDTYKKPNATKQYEANRDVYPSHSQSSIHETPKYRPADAPDPNDDDDDYPATATNDYAPVQQQYYTKPAVYGAQLGRSNTYHGAQPRTSSAKQRNPPQGTSVPYLVETCTHFRFEPAIDPFSLEQKANSGNLTREKAISMNRGTRSGSAPTPTPPPAKPTVNGSNFAYNRRSIAVPNDERIGANEKNSGAQAKVNQKFVSVLYSVWSEFDGKRCSPALADVQPSTDFSRWCSSEGSISINIDHHATVPSECYVFGVWLVCQSISTSGKLGKSFQYDFDDDGTRESRWIPSKYGDTLTKWTSSARWTPAQYHILNGSSSCCVSLSLSLSLCFILNC